MKERIGNSRGKMIDRNSSSSKIMIGDRVLGVINRFEGEVRFLKRRTGSTAIAESRGRGLRRIMNDMSGHVLSRFDSVVGRM